MLGKHMLRFPSLSPFPSKPVWGVSKKQGMAVQGALSLHVPSALGAVSCLEEFSEVPAVMISLRDSWVAGQ